MKNTNRGRPVGQGAVNRKSTLVGDLIRTARIDLGLSLRYVAEDCQVSLMFISNIEKHRAPLPFELIPSIARSLQMDENELAFAALRATKSYQQYEQFITG